ncbi:Uncharacterised protein [Micrococcus luteus]|nr:Uncharacterised protein [Micrococcus luteus]
MGTVGDSFDNALAETVNGLYKAALIHAKRVVEAAAYTHDRDVAPVAS